MASKDGEKMLGDSEKLSSLLESGNFDSALPLLEQMPLASQEKLSLPKNRTPLHFASQHGRLDVAQRMVNSFKYWGCLDWDDDWYTPLHVAAQYGQLEVLKYLVSLLFLSLAEEDDYIYLELDASVKLKDFLLSRFQNSVLYCDGTTATALHVACAHGQLQVAQYLIGKLGCNPNEPNEDGMNCLHLAAEHGYLSIVKYLVEETKGKLNSKSGYLGTVADHAVGSGHLDILQYLANTGAEVSPLAAIIASSVDVLRCLMDQYGCDPSYQSSKFSTPLHYACGYGNMEKILYFINEENCDPSCRDHMGSTPLMFACENGCLEAATYLIEEKNCNPNNTNDIGLSSLHHAVFDKKSLEVVKFLIEHTNCDVSLKDIDGDGIVHCAASANNLDTLKYLIDDLKFEPNPVNDSRITPLHLASQSGSLDVVKYLVETKKCGRIIEDFHVHPMLLAVERDHFEVAKYYIEECHCFKAAELILKGKALNTPLKSRLISHILYDIPVKVFVLGNSGAGKSTLTKALTSENQTVLARVIQVKGVLPLTPGVVPTNICDKKAFGNLSIYDFAGHEEYYASHEMILLQTSQPLVLLTVNMTLPETEIEKQIRYWISIFSASASKMCGKNARIVVIGSHADKTSKKRKAEIATMMESLVGNKTNITYHGFIGCDCRYSVSNSMKQLREGLQDISRIIRASISRMESKESYNFYKSLSFFLDRRTSHDTASITVGDLCRLIKLEESDDIYLNQLTDTDTLFQTCTKLSSRDHRLFFPHDENPEESLLILNEKIILSQVHACLQKIKEVLGNEMGILSDYQLKSVLKFVLDKSIRPEIAIKYLLFSQFCTQISQNQLLTAELDEDDQGTHYFFPNLVKASKSDLLLFTENDKYSAIYTWGLKCSLTSQFFTPRYLHTLFIQLIKCGHDTNSKCDVWKNGIFLVHSNGTRSIIEITDQTTHLYLAMQCVKGFELQLVEQRASLITLIKHVMTKVCPDVSLTEFLFHPQYAYPPKNSSEIPITEVARSVMNGNPFIVTTGERDEFQHVPFSDLVFFDSFHKMDRSVIEQLYINRDSEQNIPDEMLPKVYKAVSANEELQDQLHESSLTYNEVYTLLHRYTMFPNGDLFTLAGIEVPEQDSQVIPAMKCPLRREQLLPPLGDKQHSIPSGKFPLKFEQQQPSLGDKPRMYQLELLKVKGQRLKIVQKVATVWDVLARALEFDDDIVENIRHDCGSSCERSCKETFRRWLNEEACQPITWERLTEALVDAEKGELASQLKELLDSK